MKRFNSVEEIVKWLENHSDYGYYVDNNYCDVRKKLNDKIYNCKDR